MAIAHEALSLAARDGQPGEAAPRARPEDPLLGGTPGALDALRASERKHLALFENLPQEVFV